MTDIIKHIVIVGGGTAGWMVASRLSAKHQARPDSQVTITLIESPSIKPVGVDEGTWPSMRSTLDAIGISEAEFIKECDATFKQGSKFNGWITGMPNDSYYHPFVAPRDFMQTNMVPFWQQHCQSSSFADTVCEQSKACEQGLAPKQIFTPEYASVNNYGYHLNAGKFAELLKKHCLSKFSVKHIKDDVINVNSTETGDIASLTTKGNGDIQGDLFIDCSGFASILIGEHFQVPFIEKLDTLFVDTALAVQVPYDNEQSPISSVTQSTATSAGWIWDIGLINRKGIGHVYSSKHTTESMAEQELVNYLGKKFKGAEITKIPVKPGHRDHPWEKNCVAIGLSAGFLEPLEASAIVQVELSAQWLCEQLPSTRSVMGIISKRFNEEFSYRWGKIIEFLKLHYVLSQRTEDFWVDNRKAESIPESLQDSLELWKHQFPWKHDFTRSNEIFGSPCYQYILSGMGFKTQSSYPESASANEIAMKNMQSNAELTKRYLQHLPKHRDLLNQIREKGFQNRAF